MLTVLSEEAVSRELLYGCQATSFTESTCPLQHMATVYIPPVQQHSLHLRLKRVWRATAQLPWHLQTAEGQRQQSEIIALGRCRLWCQAAMPRVVQHT